MRLNGIKASILALILSIPGRGAIGSNPQIWQQPPDIGSRDLYNGPGGKDRLPNSPFVFVKEDFGGSSVKFVVEDDAGTMWNVKLGPEAQPETVATRLVWSVGYFTDENYFLPRLQVLRMPAKLKRGQDLISPDGFISNARLERNYAGEKKVGAWRWRENPFKGTREFNGLRVLMALLNNWDLKDENNAVYAGENSGPRTYVVSDLGEAFGAPAFAHPSFKARNYLPSYRESRFITKVTSEYVDFENPERPAFVRLFDLPDCIKRLKMRWIGRHIPRADAKWAGQLLARLSRHQISDAFRAAGYSPSDIDGFSAVVEERIKALNQL